MNHPRRNNPHPCWQNEISLLKFCLSLLADMLKHKVFVMNKYSVLLFLLVLACTSAEKQTSPSQLEAWEKWKVKRMEELKSKEGFLNLAGLYWLKEGENSFGSDSSNSLIFPTDFPAQTGTFIWEDEKVSISGVAEGILIDSVYLSESLIFDMEQQTVKEMTYGSYVWYIIERTGNVGVRLKDLNHPLLKENIDIHFYDHNPELVVEAVFRPYLPPKKLAVENVLGHQFEFEIEGQLQFEMMGKNYTLEPMKGNDNFFIIFSDETSAIETYGSGRYMYSDRPGPNGKTIIDFNRAYNPPCAFTDFATCLIPPPENRLTFRVEAGELDYHME